MRIVVLNGPNLNLLGTREPEVYGPASFADLERDFRRHAGDADVGWFQTNHEGELVDFVQAHGPTANGMLVNAAAFTHTSVAVRDALLAVATPFVEVHLSNIYAREEFRRRSLLADVAVGIVAGFGSESYRLGLLGLLAYLEARS